MIISQIELLQFASFYCHKFEILDEGLCNSMSACLYVNLSMKFSKYIVQTRMGKVNNREGWWCRFSSPIIRIRIHTTLVWNHARTHVSVSNDKADIIAAPITQGGIIRRVSLIIYACLFKHTISVFPSIRI